MPGSARVIRDAARSAADIAAELRREFETSLQARLGTQSQPDPVLATLFHALAAQVAKVYDDAETTFPLAVLDDLIEALRLPGRLAAPAQTVARFTGIDRREVLPPETQLVGFSPTGEHISFLPDAGIELAPTELVLAAAYENGRLQLLPGSTVPHGGAPLPPVATAVALGPAPAIYLALRCDAGHLRGLGVHIECARPDGPVATALQRSPWQLLDGDGRLTEQAVLRPRVGRGGVQRLEWLQSDAEAAAVGSDPVSSLGYPAGMYGGSCWILPDVPAERQFTCAVPAVLAAAVQRVYPADHNDALRSHWTWLRIPLPAGTAGVANAVQRVAVNCVTASNIEIWNEHIGFARSGSVVSLMPEGRSDRHFMGVLAVTGEAGGRYSEVAELDAAGETGRYRARAGRLELQPARGPTGRFDAYAMVRLLYCDGVRGNGLGVGDVRRIATPLVNLTAQVTNVTVSRGGADADGYSDARTRFAEALRTRERIITPADVEIAARAWDARIRTVSVEPDLQLTTAGPQPVQRVLVVVDAADFADPAAEMPRLREALQQYLQARVPLGAWPVVVVSGGTPTLSVI
jgi:hypothetical protein